MPDSITSTNLSAAISNTYDRVITVVSATGFTVGHLCYVDREAMSITGVNGTLISVRRGAFGTSPTPHTSGSRIFVAKPSYFTTYDRAGAGTYVNEQVQPYINIQTGKIWSVVGSRWVEGSVYNASATNYGLSEAIWSDCPLDKMLVDPGYGSYDGDDFAGAAGVPFTTAYKYVLTGTSGTFTVVASILGGAALLSTAGADKEEAYLISGSGAPAVKADATTTWWYEARVKLGQIATAQGQFVGLSSEAGADFMVDDTNTIKVVDWIGFQVLAATDIAAIWQTAHCLTGGARAAVNATAATGSLSYMKLGMKSVAGTVTFFVDGVPQAATVLSSATNFPLNKYLFPVFAAKNGSGVVSNLTIDWWKVASTRIAN